MPKCVRVISLNWYLSMCSNSVGSSRTACLLPLRTTRHMKRSVTAESHIINHPLKCIFCDGRVSLCSFTIFRFHFFGWRRCRERFFTFRLRRHKRLTNFSVWDLFILLDECNNNKNNQIPHNDSFIFLSAGQMPSYFCGCRVRHLFFSCFSFFDSIIIIWALKIHLAYLCLK